MLLEKENELLMFLWHSGPDTDAGIYSILWREVFFHVERSAGHCLWTFLPAILQGVYFSFFQRMSLCLRLTEALVDLFILILIILWEPGEAEAAPFGAWCYFSHAPCTAITQSFSNLTLTQMWSSKADANCYTNSIVVAFSCSRRFIASHNPINYTKSLEFLKFKEEVSAAALAEPEDLVSKTAGVNCSTSLSPASSGQLPSPMGHRTGEVPLGLAKSSRLRCFSPSTSVSSLKQRLQVMSLSVANRKSGWSRQSSSSPVGSNIVTSHPRDNSQSFRHCSTEYRRNISSFGYLCIFQITRKFVSWRAGKFKANVYVIK